MSVAGLDALALMIGIGGGGALVVVALMGAAFWVKDRYWPSPAPGDDDVDGPY